MKYAAQYRDMHTGIHHLIICEKRKQVASILDVMKETETLEQVFMFDSLDDIEINFRNPPVKYKEENLSIVNESRHDVPDVY